MADLTSAILECLGGTMIPDTQVVLAAQQRLYQLEQTPGVLNTYLQIVTAVDTIEPRLRLAASMRVKRIVLDNWGYTSEDRSMVGSKFVNIVAEDREIVRQNLIPHALLPERFKPITNMLLDALFVIIRCDLASHADHFAGQCLAAVQSASQDTLLNAIKCYVTFFKVTVYVVGSVGYPRYNVICTAAYEALLPMLSSLLQSPLTEQTGRLAESLMKALYKSLQMYVPTFMRAESVQDTLIALLCGFITQPVAEEDREEVSDSAENSEGDHFELKTRKWAMRIVHAFMHVMVPKTLPKNLHKGYATWAKSWVTRYGSAAATVAYTVIEQHKTGVVPMSDRCWFYTLQILDVCVDNAALYKSVVKPHLEAIVLDGVMRALAVNRNDLEEWTRDPSGFVVQVSAAVIYRSTHRDAARRLLATLVATRTRSALGPIMELIQSIFASYAAADAAGRQAMVQVKDGALSAVAALHKYLSAPDYAAATARLIEEHVGMEFNAPASPPVLAVRGLNVIASYVTLPFNKDFLYPVVQYTISALRSGDRSLQLEGANALSKLTRVRSVLKALKPDVAPLLKTVLDLMALNVSETLGIVMRRLLERFSAELVPHALSIVQQLVALTENAMGVVAGNEQKLREQLEGGGGDAGAAGGGAGGDDFDDFDDEDDAATEALRAAGQYIESMATIAEAFDGHDAVLAQVEVMVLPLLNHVFKTENTELLAEALRLIQALTYAGSRISETLWSIFPTVVQCVHSDWGCHYVEDVVPPLVNYSTANDAVELFQVPDRVDAILSVPEKFFLSPEDEASAQRSAILLRTLLGNCGKGQMAAYYPRVLAMCVPAMEKTEAGNVYFCMLALDCVAALCFHDPVLFLTQLEQTGLLERCFNSWFSLIEHLTAAQVLEYPMLAMSALVTAVPTTQLPGALQPHAHVLVGKMIEMLFQIYKAEIEHDDDEDEGKGGRKDTLFDDIDSDQDADDQDDDADDGDAAEHGEETVEDMAKSMEGKLEALANDAAAARAVMGGGMNFRAEEIPFKTDMDKENVFERYLAALQLWVQRDGAAFPEIAANVTAAEGAVAPLLNYANKRAGEVKAELEAEDEEDEEGLEGGEDSEDGFEEDDYDPDMAF